MPPSWDSLRVWTESRRNLFILGLTLILVGYFAVWLPHEAAGLSYIGLEMGEQAKFLPQVRSGAIVPGRSLFYLPPITLALLLLLFSSDWPANRWQTWFARLLALAVSLLAFPAFEVIGGEPAEWLWRIILIGIVVVMALFFPIFRRISLPALLIFAFLTAAAGAILPSWVFWEVRSAYSAIMRQPIGIGWGFWLNVAGHLLVGAVALIALLSPSRSA